MINLSKELIEKIKIDMRIDEHINWKLNRGSYDHVGVVNFSGNDELYNECINWLKIARCGRGQNFLRVDKIGRFRNLRPEGHSGYDIHFRVGEYDKESWKDWFEETKEDFIINGNM